jgi:3-hydroxybutyryl-CoA dehydrogenase
MTKSIKTVGVCGAAGTMGAGIALVAARAGFRTISYDMKGDALERAGKQSAAFLDKSVARGKLEVSKRDAIVGAMSHTTDTAELGACDLVIEAVFEDLATKRDLLKRLDEVCAEDAIFASNTSTLSITEIASGSKLPERVVGMHFCLPAQLMKLIEMSPGILTSEETFDTAWEWTKACGQIPVKTQDKPGFILNALLVPFNNDAIRVVEAGVASAADVDKAIKTGLGYKMGPARTDRPDRARYPGPAVRGLLPDHAGPQSGYAPLAEANGRRGPARTQIWARLLRLRRQRNVWSLSR